MAALNVDYIAWIITVLGAINSNLTFIFGLNYFLWKLNIRRDQGQVPCLKQNTKFFDLKRHQVLESQSKTLKVSSNFLSPMLSLQSYWRPTGHNFGAPKNKRGLCFQVLGSLGVLGGLRALCFQDTRKFPQSYDFLKILLPYICGSDLWNITNNKRRHKQ